jgi:hypothetical protein
MRSNGVREVETLNQLFEKNLKKVLTNTKKFATI